MLLNDQHLVCLLLGLPGIVDTTLQPVEHVVLIAGVDIGIVPLECDLEPVGGYRKPSSVTGVRSNLRKRAYLS